jgi:O-antigen ligase
MRRVSRALVLLYVFAIPWEYSLDLGAPWGNIARIAGLVLLLVAIPDLAQAGRIRTPAALHWLTLALLLWFACTLFWTSDPIATWTKLRGYVQQMMIVWLLWEFVESPHDLHVVLQAWLAGSWVLVVLTIADSCSADAIAAGQMRFSAVGQDPNDVARFLDLGFPIAALLIGREGNWMRHILTVGYLPTGAAAVLLTASRGGFVAAFAALVGCAVILHREHFRALLAVVLMLPAIVCAVLLFLPHAPLARLTTIGDQVHGGDLNQRLNIWEAGWKAFTQAPFLGHGAGSFVNAAGLAPIDTAHNTALSILVEAGVVGLVLPCAIVAVSVHNSLRTQGAKRIALLTLLATWTVSAIVGTTAESRTTWLMFGVIAVAARFAAQPATISNPAPAEAGTLPSRAVARGHA